MRAFATILLARVLAVASTDFILAQQPPKNTDAVLRDTPNLLLTSEQKLTIYTSLSNQPVKETAPPTFRAAIGESIPPSIELRPLPPTIVQLLPQTKELTYAMVANQALLADKDRRIIEIISHSN